MILFTSFEPIEPYQLTLPLTTWMLEANSFWQETDGATLGINPNLKKVIFSQQVMFGYSEPSEREVSLTHFEQQLSSFLQHAEHCYRKAVELTTISSEFESQSQFAQPVSAYNSHQTDLAEQSVHLNQEADRIKEQFSNTSTMNSAQRL